MESKMERMLIKPNQISYENEQAACCAHVGGLQSFSEATLSILFSWDRAEVGTICTTPALVHL